MSFARSGLPWQAEVDALAAYSAAATDLSALLAVPVLLRDRGGQGNALSNGTYGLLPDTIGALSSNGGRAAFYLDPAKTPALAGESPKLFVAGLCSVNNVGVGTGVLTVGLYPLTSPAGASTVVSRTAGTVVSGSTVAFGSPLANTDTYLESGDFDPPAVAGVYGLCLSVTGGWSSATGSAAVIRAGLYARRP